MNVLITGATGFVGKTLTLKLISAGFECAVLVRNIEKSLVCFGDAVKHIRYDKYSSKYKKQIEEFNPKYVIHLASLLTSNNDKKSILSLIESNIEFTALLLDSLKNCNIEAFINTGSSSEYLDGLVEPKPAYFYSATKTAVRSIIKYYQCINKFKFINIIPYTIYGINDTAKKVIDFMIEALDNPNIVEMTEGEQVLDFIHLDDIVDFYLHLLLNIQIITDSYSEYHVGTGKGTKLKELAGLLETLSQKKANITWGAIDYRPCDIMYSVAPITKLKTELNWTPKISLLDGLKNILKINVNE